MPPHAHTGVRRSTTRMLYRLRRRLDTAWFNAGTRGVLSTPPVRPLPSGAVTFVSQICHADVIMYLVALKSLARFVTPRRVVALDDGSLTAVDRTRLAHHVEGIELGRVADVRSSACPVGGAWERLLFIADAVATEYVVQIDADTLTLSAPIEVEACIRGGRSFTLGTQLGPAIIPIADACAAARRYAAADPTNTHVQTQAEARFDGLRNAAGLRYVRGNAGFGGYAPGSFTRAALEDFSVQMRELLGPAKWAEWGSEQVASNFVVANAPDAVVLPFARYGYYHPERPVDDYVFVHFIGDFRFQGGTYRRLACSVVEALRDARAARP